MKYLKKKTEVIYGFHSVFEALNARKRIIYKVFINSYKISDKDKKIILLAKKFDIQYEIIKNKKLFLNMKDYIKYRMFAIVSPIEIYNLNIFMKQYFPFKKNCLFLILDGIMDPNNFGAIIRTAFCFGISGIFIMKNRACPPTPAVSNASAGALEHISICSVSNIVNTIKILKKNGFWIIGTSPVEKTLNFFNLITSELMAIVIGNEGSGLRQLTKKECDFIISIPMKNVLGSLNASVSTALVLYEIYRQKFENKKV